MRVTMVAGNSDHCGSLLRRSSRRNVLSALRSLPFIAILVLTGQYAMVGQFREAPPLIVSAATDTLPIPTDVDVQPSTGEKLLWLAGASAAFSLFDYIGFNMARTDDGSLKLYRVMQVLVQAGLTWLLHEQAGLGTAVAFNVVWWTWGMDALYYVYTDMFDAGGHWEKRGAFERAILGNQCTWAWWTPLGISRGMDNKRRIAGDALMAQMALGAAAAITITVTF
jgi:hypothetical protein